MTQITPSHRLANRATLAVSTVLARAGALAEQIKNDYGEDLFVQTQLDDEADHFRILIQVKGTTLKSGSNKYHSFRMDVPHLQRWVGHIEPILVCVYDDGSDKIYAFSPNERFSLWELCTTEKKTLTTKLSEDDVFDEFTAKRFIWKCRLMHFSRMLAWYENSYNYVEYHEHLDRSGSMNFREGNRLLTGAVDALLELEDAINSGAEIDFNMSHKIEDGVRGKAPREKGTLTGPLLFYLIVTLVLMIGIVYSGVKFLSLPS